MMRDDEAAAMDRFRAFVMTELSAPALCGTT